MRSPGLPGSVFNSARIKGASTGGSGGSEQYYVLSPVQTRDSRKILVDTFCPMIYEGLHHV
jgi:tetrahydromethanopterin S-methyltransferase subunit D